MDPYLESLKQMIIDCCQQIQVKIYLIGSRARGNFRKTSDVDIGILPLQNMNDSFFTHLRELVEESNIPYTVDIIDLSKLSDAQQKKFLNGAVLWKDSTNV